jgi:hypothetical protein
MDTVVGIGIPVTMKLSKAVEHFEQYGDVVRASIDTKRRQKYNEINIFITYADKISAKRAIEASYLLINDEKVKIEPEKSRKRKIEEEEESKAVGRFQISSKVTRITSTSSRNKEDGEQGRNEREKSPAIKSFIRQKYKAKSD